MKKFKTFLFSCVPFLLGIGLQFLAVYYLLFIAAIFLFGVAPVAQGVSYDIDDLIALTSNMDFTVVMSMVFSVFCTALFGIWYYRSCGGNFKINFKKSFHPMEILGILLLIPGTQFISNIITSLISVAFPSWLEDYLEMMENAGLSGDISLLMIVYSVLLAPISEELIFRGVTYGIARRHFSFWAANVIQALLFGIFHMNLLQGCYTFILGLVLGYIYEKGGSIYHVILFHFLFNLWGTMVSQLLVIEHEMLMGLIIICGAIIGMSAGLLLFNKGNRLKKNA